MRLGVQAYPKPMIKMGLNYGKTYPGLAGAVHNLPFFTFGSTCEPDGTVMRFGPRWKAQAMDEILGDAFALTEHVAITEYGSDANVYKWQEAGFAYDDQAQAVYLQQLTEQIHQYSMSKQKQIEGLYWWSDLRSQMEWENGHEVRLALITPQVNEERQLIGWESTPASEYIKKAFGGGSSSVEDTRQLA